MTVDSSRLAAEDAQFKLEQLFERDLVKHYVRTYGWVPYAEKRLKTIRQKDKDYPGLKYFTLCGGAAIDIFQLYKAGLIVHNGLRFPGVTFCEVKEQSFIDAKNCLSKTLGFPERFEDAILKDAKFRKTFPYDVLNLDFTGVVFPGKKPYPDTLIALEQIFELQAGRAFTLFLTLRADQSRENPEAVKDLIGIVRDNLTQKGMYESQFNKIVTTSPEVLAEKEHLRFLLIAVPKLVLSYAIKDGYVGNLSEGYFYSRIHPKGKIEITKYIFEFEKLKAKSVSDVHDINKKAYQRYLEAACASLRIGAKDVESVLGASGSTLKSSLEKDLKDILDLRNRLSPRLEF